MVEHCRAIWELLSKTDSPILFGCNDVLNIISVIAREQQIVDPLYHTHPQRPQVNNTRWLLVADYKIKRPY